MKTTITKEIVKWINYYDVSYDLDDPVKVYQEKAPELTDTIINMIVEEIEKYANSQTDKTVARYSIPITRH
jgi:hypothetical protein